VLSDGDTITLKDLPDEMQTTAQPIVVDSSRTEISGTGEFAHFERLAGGEAEVISISSESHTERVDNVSEKQQMASADATQHILQQVKETRTRGLTP